MVKNLLLNLFSKSGMYYYSSDSDLESTAETPRSSKRKPKRRRKRPKRPRRPRKKVSDNLTIETNPELPPEGYAVTKVFQEKPIITIFTS